MVNSTEIMARQIETLRKRVDSMARNTQLSRSSVENGAVRIKDATGQLTGIIGVQSDGTTASLIVAGPLPPVPTQPQMITVVGGVKVAWDGAFGPDPVTGFVPLVGPLNFSRMEVEVSADPAFNDHSDIRAMDNGSIISASGGEVTVAWETPGEQLFARLKTRTQDGKASFPSPAAGPVLAGQIGLGDLGFDLADYVASNSISYGIDPPDFPAIGTLWVKEVAVGPPARYETWRWTGAAWVKLLDQGVTDALVASAAAQSAADSKATIYTQATAPAHTGVAGSAVWFDSDEGNRPYRWNGTIWADMRLGNGAITPNSLVASNIIATGSINAALLETLLVLTTSVVAGDPNGYHSLLNDQGLRFYRPGAPGLDPTEVGRFGTSTNDFVGVVDAVGNILASIDDTGIGTFTELETGALTINGMSVDDYILQSAPGRLVAHMSVTIPASEEWMAATGEVGIGEFVPYLVAGRSYSIHARFAWGSADGTLQNSGFNLRYKVAADSGLNTVPATILLGTSSGTVAYTWYRHSLPITPNAGTTDYGDFIGKFDATATGRHRMLFTVSPAANTTNASTGSGGIPFQMWITDMGKTPPLTGVANRGNKKFNAEAATSSTPAPVLQQDVTLSPAGWVVVNGAGAVVASSTTSGTNLYQGPHPSGDGYRKCWWYFTLPSPGFIKGGEWELYSSDWFWAGGGDAYYDFVKATPGNNTYGHLTHSAYNSTTWMHRPGKITIPIPASELANWSSSAATRWNGLSLGIGRSGTNTNDQGTFPVSQLKLRLTYSLT